MYFKDANQHFFDASFNTSQLKSELETWECLHWARVILEFIALIFLLLASSILTKKRVQ